MAVVNPEHGDLAAPMDIAAIGILQAAIHCRGRMTHQENRRGGLCRSRPGQ
jgi:hypothetical protein